MKYRLFSLVAIWILLLSGCQNEFRIPALSREMSSSKADELQTQPSRTLNGNESNGQRTSMLGSDRRVGNSGPASAETKSRKTAGGGSPNNDGTEMSSGDGSGTGRNETPPGILKRAPTVSVFLSDAQHDAADTTADTPPGSGNASANTSREGLQLHEEPGPKIPLDPAETKDVWVLVQQPESIVWIHPITHGAMEFQLEDSAGLPWPSRTVKRVLENETRLEITPTLPLQSESVQTYRIVFTWKSKQSSQESSQWSYRLILDNADLPAIELPWKAKKKKKRRRRR